MCLLDTQSARVYIRIVNRTSNNTENVFSQGGVCCQSCPTKHTRITTEIIEYYGGIPQKS